MALRKRLQVVALFAAALFGVVASVIALVFRVDLLHNPDSTWDQARLALCVVTENNVAIAVGCMPACAKFMKHYVVDSSTFRSLRSRLRGSTDRDELYPSGASKGEQVMPKGTFGSGPARTTTNSQKEGILRYNGMYQSFKRNSSDFLAILPQSILEDLCKHVIEFNGGRLPTVSSEPSTSQLTRIIADIINIMSMSPCAALTALLGQQKVAVPGSAAYDASLGSYFSQQEAAIQPACIVSPQSAEDVSATVVSLQQEGCSFAVRSGGHTDWAGAANIAGGVVVDLRALNAIELNADQSIVSVGVGASWDMVYAKLDPLGRSVNGGRAASVEGVGGLTLGGGISYFSPRYGWTCDTVTNFQIVLANGSIVDANTVSNPNLFKALKGGNNNFGIVTRVNLTTFEQGLIWAATVYNNLTLVDDVIAQFVKINSPTAYDEYASLITTFGYSQAQGMAVISSNLEYTQPVENPPVSLSLVTTLVSSAPVIKAAYEAWNASLPAVRDVPNLVYALALEPLPPIFYSRHATTNALGLEDRTDSLIITLVSATWFTPADDALVNATAQSLLDAIKTAAQALGGFDPYIYLNYAGQNQNPIASYGAQSVNQLREVRKTVDPKKVFTYKVPGGYKIPS
ncbi:hypothetical protein B7494_g6728 [Chlorociboria aeruginascens]|nr:hypothetical protein B7494_g6728 [Chlorociboria aeruginascens]